MTDWYSAAREADGRTDEEIMAEIKYRADTGAGTPLTAEDFWRGICFACAHPAHEMTCHEPVPNGDPSNGPAYCPCADRIEWMEREIIRLRSRPATDPAGLDVAGHALLAALEAEAEHESVVRLLLRRMPEVAAFRARLSVADGPEPS